MKKEDRDYKKYFLKSFDRKLMNSSENFIEVKMFVRQIEGKLQLSV